MRVLVLIDVEPPGQDLDAGLRDRGLSADRFRDLRQADASMRCVDYRCLVLDETLSAEVGARLARWRIEGIVAPALRLVAPDAAPCPPEAAAARGGDAGVATAGSRADRDTTIARPASSDALLDAIAAFCRHVRLMRPTVCWNGCLEFDVAARRLRWRGESCVLPDDELALLELLLLDPSRVHSGEQIARRVHAVAGTGERPCECTFACACAARSRSGSLWRAAAVEALVQRVRARLSPDLVRTIRGVGYALGAARAPRPEAGGATPTG
ncbi:MAG: hypothetical protein AB7P21_26675 [Lautropia sp.]